MLLYQLERKTTAIPSLCQGVCTQLCLHSNNKNTLSLALRCEHFSTFSLG